LSSQQTVAKHHHISNPPPESHSSLIDSLSDTFVNAFAKVRKPDPRFMEMAEALDKYDDGLSGVEKIVARGKARVDGESHDRRPYAGRGWFVDLSTDYQDMAAAYQGLGYLESGITEPLNRFAEKMLDFSALLKYNVGTST
jgi:sorting nexin-4